MSEADGTTMPDFVGIGPTMRQRAGHPFQDGRIDVPAVEMVDASNAAHERGSDECAKDREDWEDEPTIVDCRDINNYPLLRYHVTA